MKVLLVCPRDAEVATYAKRLRAWGIAVDTKWSKFSSSFWDNNLPDLEYLRKEAAEIYDTFSEQYDVIQYLVDPWRGPKTLLGRHYHESMSGYRVCILKRRKNWEDTGVHELMHAFEDIIYIYTGKSVSKIAGVLDWNEDVVHGRDPRFKEYEYDAAFEMIRPQLFEAVIVRKQKGTHNLMQRLIQLYRTKMITKEPEDIGERLHHPVPYRYQEVSQHFNVYNPAYPQTRRHIGTDYKCPIATPLYAPVSGRVVSTTQGDKVLGHSCIFEFEHEGRAYAMRCLHLIRPPVHGEYERGDVFAETGSSGMSSGPHAHIEIWHGKVSIPSLKGASDILKHMVDPVAFFKNAESSN